jgi:hypothetical protein
MKVGRLENTPGTMQPREVSLNETALRNVGRGEGNSMKEERLIYQGDPCSMHLTNPGIPAREAT